MSCKLVDKKLIVRGAGEMASGSVFRLYRAGFRNLLLTEIEAPLTVRRLVSFSPAVYEGSQTVEGTQAVLIAKPEQAEETWRAGLIPLLVDPENESRHVIKPDVVLDAILAKKNLGTSMDDAPLVIGLGPGFCAGGDVHYVVETNRGHNLGRLIFDGYASPNTGTPGDIGGQSTRRVLRAPSDGIFHSDLEIGVLVEMDQTIGYVGDTPVKASLAGALRGLIRPGTLVTNGLKIGDIDPRGDSSYCYTISEKARAIGGTVLEAIMMRFHTGN
jgi:xanthine dehydrogenase accessory factor